MTERLTGKIKWFSDKKFFGFIEREGQTDVFIHGSNLNGAKLKDGMKVSFELKQDKKHKKHEAVNLEIIETA